VFAQKLTQEEKTAAAAAKRAAKKAAKGGGKEEEVADSGVDAAAAISAVAGRAEAERDKKDEAVDKLADAGTICTYSQTASGVDDRSRDINVQNFTMLHKGTVFLDECEIVLSYGNRYGLIGSNGSGKSTFLNALGARAVPIPEGIDMYHLKEEVAASEMTAFEAVMSVDEVRKQLEKDADDLNHLMSSLGEDEEEKQEQIMEVRTGRRKGREAGEGAGGHMNLAGTSATSPAAGGVRGVFPLQPPSETARFRRKGTLLGCARFARAPSNPRAKQPEQRRAKLGQGSCFWRAWS
jgi:hypothetical protein